VTDGSFVCAEWTLIDCAPAQAPNSIKGTAESPLRIVACTQRRLSI
jgi:hypothetical protein